MFVGHTRRVLATAQGRVDGFKVPVPGVCTHSGGVQGNTLPNHVACPPHADLLNVEEVSEAPHQNPRILATHSVRSQLGCRLLTALLIAFAAPLVSALGSFRHLGQLRTPVAPCHSPSVRRADPRAPKPWAALPRPRPPGMVEGCPTRWNTSVPSEWCSILAGASGVPCVWSRTSGQAPTSPCSTMSGPPRRSASCWPHTEWQG